jgi:hypothetical protein
MLEGSVYVNRVSPHHRLPLPARISRIWYAHRQTLARCDVACLLDSTAHFNRWSHGGWVVAALIPAVLIAMATKNTSGGNWADHLAQERILHAVEGPYFVFPILAACVFGALSRRYSRSLAARWVWVFPAAVLLWNVFTWRNGGYRPYWPDVWNNYFGPHCGSSECAYELFVTAPFYTSFAYTFGWTMSRALPDKLS